MIYTTNAVESLHMSLRKIIKTRGSFPSEEAALKLIYLALRNVIQKWDTVQGWKQALNHFQMLWGDRLQTALNRGRKSRMRNGPEQIPASGQTGNGLRQQGIWTPPFPFPPPGESRGGRVPPTPTARCAASKKRWHASCAGSPHKRAAAPLCIPRTQSGETFSPRLRSTNCRARAFDPRPAPGNESPHPRAT